jgi:hypothetical protein
VSTSTLQLHHFDSPRKRMKGHPGLAATTSDRDSVCDIWKCMKVYSRMVFVRVSVTEHTTMNCECVVCRILA